MEQMPYRPERELPATQPWVEPIVSSDWRAGLPVLAGHGVTLRDLRVSDAGSLCALLTTEEVARFISPPPTTVDGFERFILWTHRQRAAASYVCFAVTKTGTDTAIGIFQLRALGDSFSTAEWGFVLGSAYWGTGIFAAGADLVLDFAFRTIGVQRLEARAAERNGRGNGALQKMGATQEARLRKSFRKNDEYLDQFLWAIHREQWEMTRTATGISH
jgi:RimJ/RimL family protein N-acetyltransferase